MTHVSINDLTFNHGGLYGLSFGLGAPDGTRPISLPLATTASIPGAVAATANSPIDDAAQEGLSPPNFPNTGDAYRPAAVALPFNGKASNGACRTLYLTDDNESGGGDVGDTTGDLFSWSLEVCVDMESAGTRPTPTMTPTPEPQPNDGAPTGATGGAPVTVTPTPETCTATVDPFEDDDSVATAKLFDMAAGSSAGHTFDNFADADRHELALTAGLQYTITAQRWIRRRASPLPSTKVMAPRCSRQPLGR